VGCALPDQVLTNDDFAGIVETSDEWIRQRTGIRERRRAEPGTPTSALAIAAGRAALEQRGMNGSELDLIIVGTMTPDMPLPATACLVQHGLGASRAWAFDLSAACSGFIYAATIAAQFIESGSHRRVLVVGAEVMSSVVDYSDRTTCVLFGDGAGAVIMEPSDDETGIFSFCHEADGAGAAFLCMPAGGSAAPASHQTIDKRLHFLRQDGSQVFRFATRKMVEVSQRVLAKAGVAAEEIDLFVPHQANARIIDAVAERLRLPSHKVVKNLDRLGNTSAASIPLALTSAVQEGRLSRGALVLLASVGAGFTVGSMLLRWSGTQ
jgi:3-oxoacyl-[acyl-carrier-protein] synthase-3